MRKGFLGAVGVSLVSALLSQAEPNQAPSLLPLTTSPTAVQSDEPPTKAPEALPKPAEAPANAAAPAVAAPALTSAPQERPYVDYNQTDDRCGRTFWLQADYLIWWIKSAPTTLPLLTTGDPGDPVPGGIGQPNTQIIFGEDNFKYHAASGLRLTAGYWFNNSSTFGIEGSYFVLERRSDGIRVSADANGVPLIARPIVSAANGALNTELTSLPQGGFTGTTNIDANARFQGFEINAVLTGYRNSNVNFNLLGGFRSLDLNEGLTIEDTLVPLVPGGFTFLGNPVAIGDVATDFDRFHTVNKFYGFQLGGRVEWQGERLTLGLLGKLALGTTQQQLTIDGNTGLFTPGVGTAVVPGGVLTQSTNIGRFYHDSFSFIPEIGVNANFQLTSAIRLSVGYSVLWWNNVLRPADQIDGVVNRFLVPTDQVFGQGVAPARPAFQGFQESNFWAQGFNFGVQFSY